MVVKNKNRKTSKNKAIIEPKEIDVSEMDLGDTGFDDDLDADPRDFPKLSKGKVKGKEKPKAKPAPEVDIEEEEPVAPKHPSYLVEMAKNHGMTDAEIEEESTEVLGRTVRRLDKKYREHMDEMNRERSRPERREAPPPEPEKPAEVDWGTDKKTGQKYTEDDYPEPVAIAMKEVHTLRTEQARLKKELQQERESRMSSQSKAGIEVIDSGFSSLPKKFAKLFGSGSMMGMEKTAPEYQRRMAVCNARGINLQTANAATISREVLAGAELIFPSITVEDDEEEPEETDQEKKKRQWREGTVARPTSRGETQLPKGVSRAEKKVAAKMRQIGVTDTDFEHLEEAGLPGDDD